MVGVGGWALAFYEEIYCLKFVCVKFVCLTFVCLKFVCSKFVCLNFFFCVFFCWLIKIYLFRIFRVLISLHHHTKTWNSTIKTWASGWWFEMRGRFGNWRYFQCLAICARTQVISSDYHTRFVPRSLGDRSSLILKESGQSILWNGRRRSLKTGAWLSKIWRIRGIAEFRELTPCFKRTGILLRMTKDGVLEQILRSIRFVWLDSKTLVFLIKPCPFFLRCKFDGRFGSTVS